MLPPNIETCNVTLMSEYMDLHILRIMKKPKNYKINDMSRSILWQRYNLIKLSIMPKVTHPLFNSIFVTEHASQALVSSRGSTSFSEIVCSLVSLLNQTIFD